MIESNRLGVVNFLAITVVNFSLDATKLKSAIEKVIQDYM